MRTRECRWRRNEALQLISSGVPPTDAASQLTVKWGCSRRTSLRDIEIAQSELANALDSVELQQMVGWLATQYQRLAAKAEADNQFSAAVGALNALRAMCNHNWIVSLKCTFVDTIRARHKIEKFFISFCSSPVHWDIQTQCMQ